MITSRRSFLKLSGLLAGGLFLPPPPPAEAPPPAEKLGRAVHGVYIYERPSFKSAPLTILPTDAVFAIRGEAQDEDNAPNKRWWQVRQGYVHSAPVQLVRWELQTPALDVPKPGGFLGEISVPFTQTRTGPGTAYKFDYRFYYGTTHWVTQAVKDDGGNVWYGVLGDRTKTFTWLPAEHVHRVTADEIAPITPDVTDKRIAVSLEKQTIQFFENNQLIKEAFCSTGVPLRRENGKVIYGTPIGQWQVLRKRASRHMAGGDLAADDFFDLPGVPWVSYIHWWGVAMHGTYWHNDFGRPRSHGCINLPNELAKWVYRWTTPAVPLEERELEAKGTLITVDY